MFEVSKKPLTQKVWTGNQPSNKTSPTGAFPEIVDITKNPQAPEVALVPPYAQAINKNRITEDIYEAQTFLNSGTVTSAFGVGSGSITLWDSTLTSDYIVKFVSLFGNITTGTITRGKISLRYQSVGGGFLYSEFQINLQGNPPSNCLNLPMYDYPIKQGNQLRIAFVYTATVAGTVEAKANIMVSKPRPLR